MLYIWVMSQRGRFVWTIPTKPSQSWTEPGPAHDFCVWRTRLWCVSVVACKRKWLWREEVEREKSWSHDRARARGRKELLSGGRLSSLCLSWDSSAALNMPVIFNRRRNGAAPAPSVTKFPLSQEGKWREEPLFPVTWSGPTTGGSGEWSRAAW